MKYSLIIFDFDGTLVDTVEDIAFHANAVLEEYGQPVREVDVVRQAVGHGVHELLKGIAPYFNNKEEELERAVASFKRRYGLEPVRHTKPYPGALEALKGPLAGAKKAIITNKPHDLTEAILLTLGLREFFEIVIGTGIGYPLKPDPGSVNEVRARLSASRAQTAFVGDSRVDYETAANAGVDFYWASYGYDPGFGVEKEALRELRAAGEWGALAG